MSTTTSEQVVEVTQSMRVARSWVYGVLVAGTLSIWGCDTDSPTEPEPPQPPALEAQVADVLDSALNDIEQRILPAVQGIAPPRELTEALEAIRAEIRTASQSSLSTLLDQAETALLLLDSDERFRSNPDLAVVVFTLLVIHEAM